MDMLWQPFPPLLFSALPEYGVRDLAERVEPVPDPPDVVVGDAAVDVVPQVSLELRSGGGGQGGSGNKNRLC